MKKTKFGSYCLNGIANGCEYCIKGKKLVLFITGKCLRNCFYCSLSKKRKNKDDIWANERKCENVKEVIEEVKESNATTAGITGGDPFLRFKRTLKFASALKKKFGKKFHIHIYLPTRFSNKEELEKLSKYIDEVRFHPEFLVKELDNKELEKEIEKIKQASLIFGKQNTGIELPILPEKKEEILAFIKRISSFIGFANLNELEISDTNFDYITEKCKLKSGGYVISGSKEAGLWLLQKCQKEKLKLKIHLCTAETKNWFQYKNRLLRHNILPFGYKTEEGTVKYFAIYTKNEKEFKKLAKDFKKLKKELKEKKKYKKIYIDKRKKRIILSPKSARKLISKYKITRIEEYPTYDGMEVERGEI